LILGAQDRTYSAADPLIIWKPLQPLAGNDHRAIGIGFGTLATCGAGFAEFGAAFAKRG